MMVVQAIFTIIFGLFFGLIAFKFLFRAVKTIKRLQEMKYKSSSNPSNQAVIITRVFGAILMLVAVYFIGLGINFLIS